MQPIIRLYKTEDFDDITRLWFDAETAAMPKLMARMGHTLEDAREYFLRAVVGEDQIWVYERSGVPLGFLAIQGDFIDRLYVCLLYTSDAADERSSVDLGGRRIIKKKYTNGYAGR